MNICLQLEMDDLVLVRKRRRGANGNLNESVFSISRIDKGEIYMDGLQYSQPFFRGTFTLLFDPQFCFSKFLNMLWIEQ